MSDDWLAQAAQTDLNERDLKALSAVLPQDVSPALAELARDREAEAFCAVLLAALHRGDILDATPFFRAGAALLPDAGSLAAVAGRLKGPINTLLVEAATDGKLGWDLEGCALLIAAFWGRSRHVDDPPALLHKARVLARKAPSGLADEALAALVGLTDDAGLEAGLGPSLDDTLREHAREVAEYLVASFTGPVLECVPELPGSRGFSDQPIQRASAKVGRNQPCPCGSGKKYKHCHESEDRARETDASDVAGLTRAELRLRFSEHLTADKLEVLRAYELARVVPDALPRELVPQWLDQLAFHREWEVMRAAYEAFDDPELDALLADHASNAAWLGDVEDARRLLAMVRGQAPPLRAWAQAALATDPAEVGHIAEATARDHLDEAPMEAAYALMRSPWQALGILVARSVLPHVALEDAEALLAEVLDTREELGLEPWDPVEDVLYRLAHGTDPDVVRQLSEAERRLQTNQAQLSGASTELRQLRQELEARTSKASPSEAVITQVVLSDPAEDPETRALRERLAALKDELKERHSERNALRRELQDFKAEVEASQSDEEAPVAEPSDEPEAIEADAQHDGRLRLPVWSETFEAALQRVPENVARAAVDKLCAVAVGRQGAFVEVRRLRGRQWLWRAKVGRSYRLLFRLDDSGIEALDLVHRQDLEKRIKQLGG